MLQIAFKFAKIAYLCFAHTYICMFFFFFSLSFTNCLPCPLYVSFFFFLLVYLLLLTPHLTMVLNQVPVSDDNNSDVLSVFAA